MPAPVSRTRMTASPSSTSRDRATSSPVRVNFAALWSRFPTTWVMRVASASVQAWSGSCTRERDASRLHGVAEVVRRPPDDLAKIDALAPQLDLPARDAGHVEQVVHQSGEVLDLPLDDFLGAASLLSAALGAAGRPGFPDRPSLQLVDPTGIEPVTS